MGLHLPIQSLRVAGRRRFHSRHGFNKRMSISLQLLRRKTAALFLTGELCLTFTHGLTHNSMQMVLNEAQRLATDISVMVAVFHSVTSFELLDRIMWQDAVLFTLFAETS